MDKLGSHVSIFKDEENYLFGKEFQSSDALMWSKNIGRMTRA